MMDFFTRDIPMLFQQNPIGGFLLCAVILLVSALVLGLVYFQIFPKHKALYGALVGFSLCVVFLGGTFLCLYMAFDLYKNSQEAAASKNWPAVPGTVRSAWVYSIKELGSKTNTYHIGLDYKYSVEGVPYASRRTNAGGEFAPDLGEKFYSETQARAQASRLVNSRTTVYYDPVHPERAVLQPGGTTSLFRTILYLLMGLGVLFPLAVTISRAVLRRAPMSGQSQTR